MTDAAGARCRFEVRRFTIAKDADAPEHNQDAAAVNPSSLAAAIADGVSAGIFCGRWARLLVDAIVEAPPDVDNPIAWRAWLAERRAAWQSRIDVSQLAWFQKAKLRDGAFTTLLWLRIEPAAAGGASDGDQPGGEGDTDQAIVAAGAALADRPTIVRAWAVGDSCLLHVRGGNILGKFPVARAADFGTAPLGLGSVDLNRDDLVVFQRYEAPVADGDLLVLCTDALAEYYLRCHEAGSSIDWDHYWNLSEADWRQRIVALREARELRYDDATLVLVQLGEGNPPRDAGDAGKEDGIVSSAERRRWCTKKMMTDPKTRISELVRADLPNLAGHLRAWAEAHLADPRQETFSEDPDGKRRITLWLVTDHIGSEDSASRVVFDPEEDKFGLEMELQDGTHWFMGLYGGFAETIRNM
jgi:hypothetical protein